MTKYVYLFNEGNGKMRELLGGKGANLAEMMNLGLPVPDGFTVTTEACNKYYEDGKTLSEEVREQIFQALEKTEKKLGKKLGDVKNPLLVSVRSGARASHAGHDGHYTQSRTQRRNGRGAGNAYEQSPFCLRQLQTFYTDVFRRRYGNFQGQLRKAFGKGKAGQGRDA